MTSRWSLVWFWVPYLLLLVAAIGDCIELTECYETEEGCNRKCTTWKSICVPPVTMRPDNNGTRFPYCCDRKIRLKIGVTIGIVFTVIFLGAFVVTFVYAMIPADWCRKKTDSSHDVDRASEHA